MGAVNLSFEMVRVWLCKIVFWCRILCFLMKRPVASPCVTLTGSSACGFYNLENLSSGLVRLTGKVPPQRCLGVCCRIGIGLVNIGRWDNWFYVCFWRDAFQVSREFQQKFLKKPTHLEDTFHCGCGLPSCSLTCTGPEFQAICWEAWLLFCKQWHP